jgi:hypothetical protein
MQDNRVLINVEMRVRKKREAFIRPTALSLGDEVPPRREFIEKHAKYANIDA